MYKILIITASENILKYKNQFLKSGFYFDFLICEKNSTYDFGVFEQQNICVENEMISIEDDDKISSEGNEVTCQIRKTKKQSQIRTFIDKEIKELETILFQTSLRLDKKINKKKLQESVESLNQIFYLDQVVDLKFNKKFKKNYLEIKNEAIYEYDHFFIEESHLTFDEINRKISGQKFFEMNDKDGFQFVGTQFFTNIELSQYPFWLMTDIKYESIYDNFYFICKGLNTIRNSAQQETDFVIDVWSWLPIEQVSNPKSSSYLQQRIQNKIEQKFKFLDLKPIPNQFFLKQPLNTKLNIKNKSNNLITFIPAFEFRGEIQINNLISRAIEMAILKLKIKKENLRSIDIED